MVIDLKDVDFLKSEIERIRALLDFSVDSGEVLEYSAVYNDQIDELIAAYISLQEQDNLKSINKNK